MKHKYPVKTPQSLPLSVPFTIRPNSLYGVHVKFWVVPMVVAIIGIILCMLYYRDIAFFLLIPIVVIAVFVVWLIYSNRRNSLTITPDAMTYVKNNVAQVLKFTDLGVVEWGLTYSGTRLYYVLYVKSKTGDIHWKFNVLNFWNTRELRTIYTSVPKEYQGAQDVQPF